jgi:hypothetical protein
MGGGLVAVTVVARAGAAPTGAAQAQAWADLDRAKDDEGASGGPTAAAIFGKRPSAELSPAGEPGSVLVSGRG